MRLQITNIVDRGVPNKERLHISVLAAADLSYYVVFNTHKTRDRVSTSILNTFWWTPFLVQPGDSVILYTGPGLMTSEARPDGKKNHFFHWGLKQTIWAEPNSSAVVLELSGWITSP